jgi:prefoldin subunit 5
MQERDGQDGDWYDNKELYEMLQGLKADITELSKEMAQTRTLIRDYNGLRQKVEDVNSRMNTLKWGVPVVVSIVGIIFTILNYAG